MLTTSPHLLVRRPSPTTAEFTVTTCPPLTIPLRLALLGVLSLRVAVVSTALLLLCSALALSPLAPLPDSHAGTAANPIILSGEFVAHLLRRVQLSPPGRVAAAVAEVCPWWAIVGACVGALYLVTRARVHTTESLLVLRGLGIQTASGGGGGLGVGFAGVLGGGRGAGAGGSTTRFIPTEKIRDVLINEAFRGFEIRYFLVVIVDGEQDVVVVFPTLLPNRRIVEAVWRGVRGCLYEPDGVRRVDEKGG